MSILSRHALSRIKDKATRLRLEAMTDDEEAHYEGLARKEAEARDRARAGNLLTSGVPSSGKKAQTKAQAKAAKAVLAAAGG